MLLMFRLASSNRRSITVMLVSQDLSTIDRTERYMRRRVSFRAVWALDEALTKAAASDAVVFYPDGFPPRAVRTFVQRLAASATLSLVIVVTRHPEQFRDLEHPNAMANRAIVLSEPAWPWEIYATIHSSLPGFSRSGSGPC
jgi:hypothetical protein